MTTPRVQAGRWRAAIIMPDPITPAHRCTHSEAHCDHSSAGATPRFAVRARVFRGGAQKCHGGTLDRILHTVHDAGVAGRVHL
jgi:hypothetical protein